MAGPTESTRDGDEAQPNMGRVKMILTELANAAQSAALSVVDEQRACAAAQVRSIAEAARAAGRSLEQSQSPASAEYINSTARQIEAVADAIRSRDWNGLVSDVEYVAHRSPTMFVAGAAALGFIAGRFLAALREPEPYQGVTHRATENTVSAAVSSASGNGQLVDWPPPTEAREQS
jgi:hypothetical protein